MDDERPRRRPREQGVVDTDDLDISHDERVAKIESGRYVITTGGDKPPSREELVTDDGDGKTNDEQTGDDSPDGDGDGDGDDAAQSDQPSDRPEVVLPRDPRKRAILARRLLTERVASIKADHALVATALVDGNVERHESVSNDVTDVFHSMLSWYANAVGSGETPPDEVLGILLLASEVQVTYPSRAIAALAASYGLDRTDSIGDLLDAIEDEGASFPPRGSR
ncbi:DUF7500 family protein [Haloferax profundi]|uniref:Uncharacterized protein n=1 Tax=Haloferax profundi TaxID=1544718 RepID=A0A0W1R686_9EURY|nr:hypothetical protein AUR66_03835 [Haloferax profundi]